MVLYVPRKDGEEVSWPVSQFILNISQIFLASRSSEDFRIHVQVNCQMVQRNTVLSELQ
jgi:hypothetical protein